MKSHVKRFADRHGKVRAYLRPPVELARLGLSARSLDPERAEEQAAEIIAEFEPEKVTAARKKMRGHASILIKAARDRAAKRGLPFDLSQEWVIRRLNDIAYQCEVSGIDFDMDAIAGARNAPFRPSLDRINPALGYSPANVRIVCVIVNAALGEWGLDTFLRVAEASLSRHGKDVRAKKVCQTDLANSENDKLAVG